MSTREFWQILRSGEYWAWWARGMAPVYVLAACLGILLGMYVFAFLCWVSAMLCRIMAYIARSTDSETFNE